MKVQLFWLIFASLLVSPFHVEAQQVKLRATLQLPVTDVVLGRSLARFKAEVEKRSKNKISIEIFDKGQLYTDDQTVGAIESGAIEMGFAGFNQFAKRIPSIDILEQPFLLNFEALVQAATSPDSEIRKLIDKAILDAVGMRVLWWQSVGNQIFISKGAATTEPHRIHDRKIRVFSPALEMFIRKCGGHPVMVSANHTSTAFATQAIEMATGSSSLVANRELWKVADTITRTWHAPIEFLFVVNEKLWQSLSEDDRAILTGVALEEEQRSRKNFSEIDGGLYTLFREKGMTVHDLTPDQVADWRACSASLIEDYIEKHAELAQQLMAAYGRLRTQPCCTSNQSTGTFSRR